MEGSDPDTTERAAGEPERGWLENRGAERAAGEATERDTTDEWRIAPARAPATVAELEGRIEAAVVTARSAEEAALEIGAASVEAAEQARRAAALAEQASAAASRAASDAADAARSSAASRDAAADAARASAESRDAAATIPRDDAAGALNAMPTAPPPARPPGADFIPRPQGRDPRRPDPFEERITAFRQRAEKVMIRLQKLEAGAAPGDGPSEVVRLK
jgi:hypothetical protein